MKTLNATSTAVALVLGLCFSGQIMAHDDDDDKEPLSRHGPNAPSGSGDTVAANCGGSFDGSDYAGQKPASGTIEASYDDDGTSESKIKIKNARPNTHYTVWVRVKGQSHGIGFGGSPVTGGGATPYAPSSELATLINDWVDPTGVGCVPPGTALGGAAGVNCSAPRANGFVTDGNGKGKITIYSDYISMAGGAYPFNRMSAATLAVAQGKNAAATAAPTAVVDPRDPSVGPGGTPFLFRMVSHCLDDASHGVSPGKRETWFNFP